MRKADRAARARQGGLAAVELALLLPMFLFLMTATAEIARALYEYNTLTKSVRVGAQYLARYGVNPGTGVFAPTDAQEDTAKALVVYGTPAAGTTPLLEGMDVGDVSVAYDAQAPSAFDTHVIVSATYQFQPLFGVIPAFGLGGDIAAPGAFVASIRMKAL